MKKTSSTCNSKTPKKRLKRNKHHGDFDKTDIAKHIVKQMSNIENSNKTDNIQTVHTKIRNVEVISFISYLPCSFVFSGTSDAFPCWFHCLFLRFHRLLHQLVWCHILHQVLFLDHEFDRWYIRCLVTILQG